MDRYLRGGELMTYRKMSMIQTRMRIAIALQKLEDLCTPDAPVHSEVEPEIHTKIPTPVRRSDRNMRTTKQI